MKLAAQRPDLRRNRTSGFTLIELMIAVAVVAILAAIALPNFLDSIRKSRRSEAFSAISAVQQAQERWRASNPQYADQLTASPPTGLGLTSTTQNGYYTLSLANVTATSYEVVATAVSGTTQANDGNCAKLGAQVTGGNVRYASSASAGSLTYAPSDRCWAR